MNKRMSGFLMACVLSLSAFVACDLNSGQEESVDSQAPADTVANDNTAVENGGVTGNTAAEPTVVVPVEHSESHYNPEAYSWDSSDVVQIALNGNSITADGEGVTVDGSKATITAAGTYSISGTLADGQIIVDTEDEDVVRLILSGANISSSTSAPIYVASAEEAIIILADGTENYVSDGASYVFEDAEEDEPNAAIFSKSDLTIYGDGSLTVAGNYNDGIASKDGLIITSGQITVNAVDDGIRGKDYLVVQAGTITVNAQGDGLKSDNEEDASKGYITIEAGVVNVTSGGDAIQAQTDVGITGGEFVISSGGGSANFVDETTSAKGIKGAVNVTIDGGTFTIDSADDAIHSNGSIVINNGTLVIASGDDGMHADANLDINDGDINITESYEGIESAIITLNGGDIHIVSRDDGLNVAGGNDGSGMMNRGMGRGGMPGGGQMPDGGQMPGDGQMPEAGQMPGPGGGPGQDGFMDSGNYYLYINGGYVAIDADGDGIDVNGSAEITGGVIIVVGPVENMNGALDYIGSFQITGGFLVASGSSGMAQAPSESSTQYSVLLNFDTAQAAGTLVHIETSNGDEIVTFSPPKQYQSLVISSPELTSGTTYNVYCGGSSTGTVNDSLYEGGTYTPGTEYTSFTISDVVTRLGRGGFR
jgi:hypothetical protein